MRHIIKELTDSDGDGIIVMGWDDKHSGVDMELTDIFGNKCITTFYKHELIKYFKSIIKELE